MRKLSNANSIGPILFGLEKPIHLLTKGSELNTIVNITAIACVDAQQAEQEKQQSMLVL